MEIQDLSNVLTLKLLPKYETPTQHGDKRDADREKDTDASISNRYSFAHLTTSPILGNDCVQWRS